LAQRQLERPREKVSAEGRELAGEKSKPEVATRSKLRHQVGKALPEVLEEPTLARKSETTAATSARIQRSKARVKTSMSTQVVQIWQCSLRMPSHVPLSW
jgi:hypothetical protein